MVGGWSNGPYRRRVGVDRFQQEHIAGQARAQQAERCTVAICAGKNRSDRRSGWAGVSYDLHAMYLVGTRLVIPMSSARRRAGGMARPLTIVQNAAPQPACGRGRPV